MLLPIAVTGFLPLLKQNMIPLLLIVVVGTQFAIIKIQKSDNEALTAKVELLEEQQSSLQEAINNQNSEIVAWEQITDQKQEELDTLSALIQKRQNELTAKINKLKAEITPQTCEGAIDYLVDKAEGVTW